MCGDATAVNLIKEMCLKTGDTFELLTYDRLTSLNLLESSLETLNKIQHGDCIVCFNKKDLYSVAKDLSLIRKAFAVIYGSMPPEVKLAQAKRFNDPNYPCKILVSTDAIGMVSLYLIINQF